MVMKQKARCGDCAVEEGEIHWYGCDMEVCPFCGYQLLSCDCMCDAAEHSDQGLPCESDEWLDKLEAKGRIPYIQYPNMCAKCGKLWPEMFHVPDEEWVKYVQPDMRRKMLCRECYDFIKSVQQ